MKSVIRARLVLCVAILACLVIGGAALEKSVAQTQAAMPDTNQTAAPGNAAAENTLPPYIDPNSPLGQVISLVQAGVEQSVVLNFVNNSTGLFNLDSEKIIYLNDLGVPSEIINAMMQHDQQLEANGAVPPQSQPIATTENEQPAEVTVNYFYSTLAPYGAWVDIAGYGWCWRPTVQVYETGWRPYCNNGHWVYTDHGWFWMSGYTWGWAAFHYGRWFQIPRYGWCWWPATTWAPAWVCWRYNRDYCGWAPLPPHALYRPGIGLVYRGRVVNSGFHFGLGVSAFTFVPTRDFHDPHPWRHRVGEREAARIYGRTKAIHRIDFDYHDRALVNPGIPPHEITSVTKKPIHPVAVYYENGGVLHGKRHVEFEHGGRSLVVKRPHFVGSPVLSLHRESAHPAQNSFQRHELNQKAPPISHRVTPQTPQSIRPSQQNEFRQRQENGAYSHPGNSKQNRVQHPGVNQNTGRNFNHSNPQTRQNPRREIPHTITPNSQERRNNRNSVITVPHQNSSPGQGGNRQPRQYYNPSHSGNRMVSPRLRGFEQGQSQNGFRQSDQRGATERRQAHFSAPANRYSPPTERRENQNRQFHYNAPRNVPGNSAQHFNRSQPQPHVIQPHAIHQSSRTPPPQNQNRGHDNGNGHGH